MITEDLLQTANTIREHGWCQKQLYDDYGSMCLLGALRFTIYGSVALTGPRVITALAALDLMAPSIWNDTPGRTVEEVILLLEQTATNLKESE